MGDGGIGPFPGGRSSAYLIVPELSDGEIFTASIGHGSAEGPGGSRPLDPQSNTSRRPLPQKQMTPEGIRDGGGVDSEVMTPARGWTCLHRLRNARSP
jgi:hypothetical protein